MPYEPPAFFEVKMDAEIGSYQEEFEFDPTWDPVHPHAPLTSADREPPAARTPG